MIIKIDPERAAPTAEYVNAERSRRIVLGSIFDGVRVTGAEDDTRNLANLAMMAQMRIASGDETLTTYRDGDNIDHALTPAQVILIWQQSTEFVSHLYAKSWALKAMTPIPTDYASDLYWA